MNQKKFTSPKGLDDQTSPNLYVANCGPSVGISFNDIQSVFGNFGEVVGVHAADETGARVIICFAEATCAKEAFEALNGLPCSDLGGRTLHIRYSVPQRPQKARSNNSLQVSQSASELGIPGIWLVHDFITTEEEQKLLAAVDSRPWQSLSKRRVQHYGYEFLYKTRNVDSKQFLGQLPHFVTPILQKIFSFPDLYETKCKEMDQLTVNEYPSGVGLSPHIDTHSAFEDLIFSLSLAGPCIMEFRKYTHSTLCAIAINCMEGDDLDRSLEFERKAVFLPPRSMLLLSGEGRYAWHHYIPHHKIDIVDGHDVRRSPRRVSFTLRKVRSGPCCCEFKQYCDSQREAFS